MTIRCDWHVSFVECPNEATHLYGTRDYLCDKHYKVLEERGKDTNTLGKIHQDTYRLTPITPHEAKEHKDDQQ